VLFAQLRFGVHITRAHAGTGGCAADIGFYTDTALLFTALPLFFFA
jgi:hypothetical protein